MTLVPVSYAQVVPVAGSADADAAARSDASPSFRSSILNEPAPSPRGPVLKSGSNTVDTTGTHGNINFSSLTGFEQAGVVLEALSSWPYIVAKLGTTTNSSGFYVQNSSNVTVMAVGGSGKAAFGGAPTTGARVEVLAPIATSGEGVRIAGASATNDNHVDYGFLTIVNTDTTNGNHARIDFGTKNTSSVEQASLAAIEAVYVNHTPSRPTTDLAFLVGDNVQERMRLKSDGTVVIGGTTYPAAVEVTGTIHSTGNITSDGVINAKYQDLAEWVPAQSGMAPGTVVVLNRTRKNEVLPSTEAYDTTVAGVVSAQPGLILGEGSDTKAKIATTGRVKVRVDASKNGIAIGDLLVTSGKSGTAMKSEPMEINGRKFHQPGTIVGKALEPLPSGEGEILVLLSLQ